jgi:hypothetical protein
MIRPLAKRRHSLLVLTALARWGAVSGILKTWVVRSAPVALSAPCPPVRENALAARRSGPKHHADARSRQKIVLGHSRPSPRANRRRSTAQPGCDRRRPGPSSPTNRRFRSKTKISIVSIGKHKIKGKNLEKTGKMKNTPENLGRPRFGDIPHAKRRNSSRIPAFCWSNQHKFLNSTCPRVPSSYKTTT